MNKILIAMLISVGLLFTGCESTQKAWYDMKADAVGTHRKVEVYAPYNGQKIAGYVDTNMRFDKGNSGVSLWLGSKNKKIEITGNPIVIITDF